MKSSDVIELVELLERRGVDVWLNGGWGIDALLGRQTRDHDDLDITIATTNREKCDAVLKAAGFATFRVDNDFNWVLIDDRGRKVDVHLVDFNQTMGNADGVTKYGPAGLPFAVGALEGRGVIAGTAVNCETAEFQVRGHTTYTPDETDYRDILALCREFGLEMPAVFG